MTLPWFASLACHHVFVLWIVLVSEHKLLHVACGDARKTADRSRAGRRGGLPGAVQDGKNYRHQKSSKASSARRSQDDQLYVHYPQFDFAGDKFYSASGVVLEQEDEHGRTATARSKSGETLDLLSSQAGQLQVSTARSPCSSTSTTCSDWRTGLFEAFRPTVSWADFVDIRSTTTSSSSSGRGDTGNKRTKQPTSSAAKQDESAAERPARRTRATSTAAELLGQDRVDLPSGRDIHTRSPAERHKDDSPVIVFHDTLDEELQNLKVVRYKHTVESDHFHLAVRERLAAYVAKKFLDPLPPGSLFAFRVAHFATVALAHRAIELLSADHTRIEFTNPARSNFGIHAVACWPGPSAKSKSSSTSSGGGCVLEKAARKRDFEIYFQNGTTASRPAGKRSSTENYHKTALQEKSNPTAAPTSSSSHERIPNLDDLRAARENRASWAAVASRFFRVANRTQTDKVEYRTHEYHSLYGKYLPEIMFASGEEDSTRKRRPLLEIGFGCTMWYGPGASADLWVKLGFKNVHFLEQDLKCVEKHQKKIASTGGYFVHIGDQEDVLRLEGLKQALHYEAEVIIDDGGHRNNQMLTSFHHLWPIVRNNGLYFIEDWAETAYYPGYLDAPPRVTRPGNETAGTAQFAFAMFLRNLFCETLQTPCFGDFAFMEVQFNHVVFRKRKL
ncbi:unnamed protein product [Amoebophrya sp. A120]|nr:unnamed protein product [Amoebophrya sp. A120]|eukprot:GSA120T00018126001.1